MIVCIKVYLCCLIWPALAGSWSQEPGIRLRHSGVECRHLNWCPNCWVDCSVPSFNVFLFSFCFNSSCNLLSSFSSSLWYSTYRRFKYWTSLQQNFALIYVYFWLKRPVDFIYFFLMHTELHYFQLLIINYSVRVHQNHMGRFLSPYFPTFNLWAVLFQGCGMSIQYLNLQDVLWGYPHAHLAEYHWLTGRQRYKAKFCPNDVSLERRIVASVIHHGISDMARNPGTMG